MGNAARRATVTCDRCCTAKTLKDMKRRGLVALVVSVSLHLFAENAAVDRRKAETITNADRLFGQRCTAAEGTPLRLYDRQTETGPPDAIIYWHGSSYVIELIFGANGAVARLKLFPEALLHSDTWSDVPSGVELSRAEMEWLIASANILQPLGKAPLSVLTVVSSPCACLVFLPVRPPILRQETKTRDLGPRNGRGVNVRERRSS